MTGGQAHERPVLIAGPIIRRVDVERVHVWIATVRKVTGSLLIYRAGQEECEPVGRGDLESVRVGANLLVGLFTATPMTGGFPTDEILTYDIELVEAHSDGAGSGPIRLADLGLLDGPGSLAYAGLALPSFYVRSGAGPVRLLHGSCRKMHGKGSEALLSADELLADTSVQPERRPCALFLTGDQFYGDDVAPEIVPVLRELDRRLTGASEVIPGIPPPDSIPVGDRMRWIHGQARFTSPKAANHLMTFGEFVGGYLLSISDVMWPKTLQPTTEHARPSMRAGLERRKSNLTDLDHVRAALPAIRRLLANIPTYAIFDDHDVTDDWNLTRRWRRQVHESPAGRRIVANALAAFWAFQGWGNDPTNFEDGFKGALVDHLTTSDDTAAPAFEDTLWNFDRWSFCAPTAPMVVCLDTRTQRKFDSEENAAILIGPDELRRVASLVASCRRSESDLLIFVSATPVCGWELHERRQKALVAQLGPYEVDAEGWHSNLCGLVDLMRFFIEDLTLERAVILSGDVHYGMTAEVEFSIGDQTIHFAQLVSSGLKHSGAVTRQALARAGQLSSIRHVRLGWSSAPALRRPSPIKQRIMMRPANTDTWDDDGPVFLSPGLVSRLGVIDPPDFREVRTYMRATGPTSSPLVGENNIGLLILNGDVVTHRLLSQNEQTVVHESTVTLPAHGGPAA